MRAALSRFINHLATELVIGVLIVMSVAITVLEARCLEPEWTAWYDQLGNGITLLFCVELSIRWYVARSTRQFFRHYWLDVIAILPLVRPLRVLRVLRLLRLVRLGVLVSRRTRKLAQVLHEGLAENLLVLVILTIVFLLGAVGMCVVEKGNDRFESFSQAAWWSLFTLMAGEPISGDDVAQTTLGRVVSMIVMLGGFTVFAMFTGVVSAVMVERLRGRMEAKDMDLEELQAHFIICGWNRSVPVVVQELQVDPQTARTPIVIVAELEKEPELPPEQINSGLVYFVRGDYTSTEVLERVGVERAAAAILVADKSKERSDQDRDARTILAALIIEKLNPRIYTSAELLHRENDPHLRMAGVENVVVGDEYMGNIIAHGSRAYGLVTVLDELLTATRGNEFYKLGVPSYLVGTTVSHALGEIKQRHDALIIALLRTTASGETQTITNPQADVPLQADDALIVIAAEAPQF